MHYGAGRTELAAKRHQVTHHWRFKNLLGGVYPPVIIFSWLWQVELLFAQRGHVESVPTGPWDRHCSLLSPSPGSVIQYEVIDGRQSDRGFALYSAQLSVVMGQPSGQAGWGVR